MVDYHGYNQPMKKAHEALEQAVFGNQPTCSLAFQGHNFLSILVGESDRTTHVIPDREYTPFCASMTMISSPDDLFTEIDL